MSTPAAGAATAAATTTAGKATAMNKLFKNMGIFFKEKTTAYIESNPDKIEEMKKHALDALQKQIDDEAEKEHTAKLALEADGKKGTKVDKLKEKTLGFIKPQVDKLAEKQTATVEANKAAKAAGKGATEESVEITASATGISKSLTKTITEGEKDEGGTAASAAAAVTDDEEGTSTTKKIDNVQELVTGLLNMLDGSNLSDDQKKKAVNGFNAAFALKQI